eukprot:NODE_1307_length_914_cov_181.701398_g1261_i0.p1 GENE.NODE_1307_length_914_cov_181.701398_g1261_i0~~NODE_1307_length_914_cov_181.701398_g1261_i0.p1  ORF type:complete len:223 (+),score=71.76 NODE_1307_length_914_cov_181.701398_g1261_i0:79-747(+)
MPKRTKSKKKDPNAPKRPITAYFAYLAENRAAYKEENPGASLTDVTKGLSAKWNALSDSGKEKFNDIAAKDKVRYNNEMKDYTPPSASEASDSDSDEPKKKKARKEPSVRKITPYMAYSKSEWAKAKEEAGDTKLVFGEVTSGISKRWKAMGESEKEQYVDKAAKLNEEREANPPPAKKAQGKKKAKEPSSSEASSSEEESGSGSGSGDDDDESGSGDGDEE